MDNVFRSSISADSQLKQYTSDIKTSDSIMRTQLKQLTERQGKVEQAVEQAGLKRT